MDGFVATLGTACAVFAGTNIDDIVILTVLFLTARANGGPHGRRIVSGPDERRVVPGPHGRPIVSGPHGRRIGAGLRGRQIVAGQYAGIAALVAVSAIAALGLAVIPDRWVGLLGLVPLALGVRGLITTLRAGGADGGSPPAVAGGVLSVASVTVANGADNISVYTPMFRTIGVTASLVTIIVFAVLTAVWCAAGFWLGSHKKIVAVVERYGHWIVPLVFVAIGTVIVLESGVAGRLIDLL
ncbi:cadmium resistance transporter [Sphaerisporangium dianthi]|uniref:Cadmium resistance transporter n=1 Tax=Sphaerisporangium dianthi TaxID=1436120 RepID=A0ABV9CDH0_9ACTN